MLHLPDEPTLEELIELKARLDYYDQQVAARSTLIDFTRFTFGKFLEAEVHRRVCAALDKFLDDVVNKRSPRLAIVMPPRHTKSELVSRRFPAYALGRYPWLQFITASHSTPLAQKMNRDVQKIMMDKKFKSIFDARLNEKNIRTVLNQAVRNSDEFEIEGEEGGLKAAGAGQAIAGFGAHIIDIDDPFGNRRDANSAAVQQNRIEWLNDDVETRLETGGGILLTHTRWHTNDLIGYIKENQIEDWDFLEFPAIATGSDWREIGEVLQPDRYDADTLKRRRKVNPIGFESLYQGNPSPAGGSVFLRELFRMEYQRNFPRCDYRIIFADTAQKKDKQHDFSCFQCWGFHVATHTAYLLDEFHSRLEYPELKSAVVGFHMKQVADTDHGKVRTWEIEDKSSGISLIQELNRPHRLDDGSLIKIPVSAYKLPAGSKVDRAEDVVGFVSSCVFPTDAPFISDYMAELTIFPNGKHDDRVDPTTMALDNFFNLTSKKQNMKPRRPSPKKLIGA